MKKKRGLGPFFEWRWTLKKLLRKIASMPFAVFILILLGVLSIGGTVIPQGGRPEEYLSQYPTWGPWILKFGLDRIFSAWWYVLATALLCLSLLFCVILRIRSLRAALNQGFFKGMRKLGSWLLHLGILLTILFFGLGYATAYQNQIYNVPGGVSKIPETNLAVAIDDFDVVLRPDDTVDRYESRIRVLKDQKEVKSGAVLVNAPLTVEGYQISQASFGFATDVLIKKEGKDFGKGVLYDGEVVTADEDRIVIQLVRLYPDVAQKDDGLYSASKKLSNPYLDYRLYYGGMLVKSGVIPISETLTAGPYELSFANARHFTVLDIRKDVFAKFAGLSSLLVVVGIFMAFFGPEPLKEAE